MKYEHSNPTGWRKIVSRCKINGKSTIKGCSRDATTSGSVSQRNWSPMTMHYPTRIPLISHTPKSNGNVRFQPEVSREFAFLAVAHVR